MNVLLDTHALIWTFAGDPTLTDEARSAIVSPENLVFVSAASVWEVSIKRALGKLRVPDDINQQITEHRFETLPMNGEHAWLAGNLPRHHSDPFDRMLIAQALIEGLVLVSRDRAFDAYGVPRIQA